MCSFNANAVYAAAFFQLAAPAKALEDHHHRVHSRAVVWAEVVQGAKLVVLQHVEAKRAHPRAVVWVEEPRPTRCIQTSIWEDIVTS